jgi:molybdate transport system regulatory protein
MPATRTTPTRARRQKDQRLALKGLLWMAVGDQSLGGPGRMGLLRAVAEHGSITQAAKAFGMSYKAAWDAINAMNALSGTPLVERSTGGRGGGFTRLTEHGRRLVERFDAVAAVHQRFLALLAGGSMDLDEEFSLLKVVNMKTSARNQWVGTVSGVRAGAVNDEVELTLAGGTRLAAIVTRESTQALGLRLQQTVVAMVKASAVLVAVDLQDAKLSARNQLHGSVRSVAPGAVNAEVVIETADGVAIVATIPQAAVRELGLAPGVPATALVKASDVILAVIA